MKYVMFEIGEGEDIRRLPVFFPNDLVHAHMVEALLAPGMPLEGWKPVSAGHSNLKASCYGESTSLGLQADPLDALITATVDYTHGIVSTVGPTLKALKKVVSTPEEKLKQAAGKIVDNDLIGALKLAKSAHDQFQAEKGLPKLTGAQQKFKGGWPT